MSHMSRFSKSPTPGVHHAKDPRSILHKHNSGLSVGIDPITLMINECMILSSAMRKMTRWSQSGVAAILGAGDIFGEDDNLSHSLGLASSNQSNGNKQSNDNPLFSSFLQLRAILTDSKDLFDIDSLTLLQPFLLAIKSSSTSGHITSLALNSISKILKYDIISYRSKNLQSTLIQISSSLTHCRFEAADQNSDDAVLLKVLRLLEAIIESPLSNLLPNEVVSEIVQTCLSLACNKKRNEVLRRAAEMAMVSITFKIFSKLKDIEPETKNIDELQTNFNDTQLPEDLIGGTEKDGSTVGTPTVSTPIVQSDDEGEVDPETKFSEVQEDGTNNDLGESYDIICINEFLGILISMISPSNQYQHMESTRVFALNLINTAIEVAGPEIPKHPSLLSLVSDPISKHILQILTTTDSPALLQASLQLFLTTAVVLGPQLKSQIELSLTLISQSIVPTASAAVKQNFNLKDANANVSTRNTASKEMLIESLSLLWTRSSTFFTNLFIDYDCDFDKSDLSSKMLEFLCKLSLPESASITTENVPPICLESVLLFISGVNDRIKGLNKDLTDIPVHELIENKKKKTSFIKCTELLNDKPKEGIKALEDNGFILDRNDIQEVANFFFTKSGRLNKKVLGEFLAKPSSVDILRSFVKLFEFKELRVDEALRILLKTFRLPGESQQIERIVELFAERYVECQQEDDSAKAEEVKISEAKLENPKVSEEESKDSAKTQELVRPDRDSVFILSYSIILLNTDLHNPQVKNQMTLDDYKRQVRGVYNGKDFPPWYLSKIYNSIRDKEIIMPEEHHGTDKWFDDTWNNLISTQASAALQPQEISSNQLCQFDRVLFESTVDTLINTLINVFKEASDDHIITRLMSSIDKCANICLYYNLRESVDKLIGSLADLTTLTSSVSNPSISSSSPSTDDLRDEIPITQIQLEKKKQTITVSEMSVWFGRDFKAQLSIVVLFRLIKKNDCKVSSSWGKIIEIIKTLFENCLLESNLFNEFQKKIRLPPLSKVKPKFVINKVKSVNSAGLLSTFSSFLKGYSDSPPEPTDQEIESTLSTIDCIKSVNIPGIFEMISKGSSEDLNLFVELMLDSFPTYSDESKRYHETETLFFLEICVCFTLLVGNETLTRSVLKKINPSEISNKGQLRLMCYTLLLTRQIDGKSNGVEAQEEEGNQTNNEYSALIELFKKILTYEKDFLSKHGSQLIQPILSLVDHESWCYSTLINNVEFWKVLRLFGSIQIFATDLLQFIEGIVKSSPSDISPENFVFILELLDGVSSTGAIASQYEQESELKKEKVNDPFYEELVGQAKKSISLTSDLATFLVKDSFSNKSLSFSLIQALAHQCFNPCREIRHSALSSLQVLILSIEVSGDVHPNDLFENGLFPLLSELSKIEVLQTDPKGFIRTQAETLSLVSKVFLKYCNDFKTEEVERVWITILDNIIVLNERRERLQQPEVIFKESVSELIKNMLLVLQSNGILSESKSDLWSVTWQKIEILNPSLLTLKEPSKPKEVLEENESKHDHAGKDITETPETEAQAESKN